METDVLIVGGGPAGLATGIALRQRGLSVVLADVARPPIDKACGEGLMPHTVVELKALGVALGPLQTIPFRGIRFLGDGRVAVGAFPEAFGLGIRRTTLHGALVERAAQVGVHTLWGTRVKRIDQGEVSLDAGKVLCRWIIGGDGQNSLVRKWAGLDRGRPEETRFGFRQHFRVAPWTDFMEVHWGCNCQIVVTPANGDLTQYEAAHRRINRPPEMMSRLLLAMENRAWLRRRALAALAREPHLFERLLAVHAGTFSPWTFGFGNFFRLGWRLLANPS